ncbi:MAG: glycosyltransferase family 4 protein [Acidimicrobiales bacterium]
MTTTQRVLIVVENESVPGDQRVWNQARALRDHGWEVVVLCPRSGRAEARREVVDEISIHRFRLPEAKDSAVAFIAEYAAAVAQVLVGSLRIRARGRIDVVQLCNPPDVLFLSTLPLKALGAGVVFDHHDLSPELWISKRSDDAVGGVVHRTLQLAERLCLRSADVVMSTNTSYRDIAIQRGQKAPDRVFVVRNGPELDRFAEPTADPAWHAGRAELIGYVGTMAVQDGVDHLVHAVHHLVVDGRDVQCLLIGDGPELESLRQLGADLGISGHLTFTGRIPADEVPDLLASADVCCCPDPPLPLNEMSTMIKVLEYLAVGSPIAMYDLAESRRSAGDLAEYATEATPRSLADALGRLLDDPERRRRLAEDGRTRAREVLAWEHQVPALLAAYERARR